MEPTLKLVTVSAAAGVPRLICTLGQMMLYTMILSAVIFDPECS